MTIGTLLRVALAVASWLLLPVDAALACGHCVEDRIAAVYDHALVQRTLQRKHEVAYFAWSASAAGDEATRRRMLAAAAGVPGVEVDGVRVSIEPGALAVAFDPARSSRAAMTAALQKRMRALKVDLTALSSAPPAP